jgi:hypothetical protein
VAVFRLTSPTIALFPEDGRHIARTVPFGAVISADELDGNKLVEVTWDNQRILMFAQDIRARGEAVDAETDVT